MNILPVMHNLQILNPANKNNNDNNRIVQPKYNKTLEKDTVSFSGSINKKAVYTLEDAIEQSYLFAEPTVRARAMNFHKALKKVCEKLADLGITYDEVYNSKHPVKTLHSYIDKYSRQGYVQDLIRGTVYWPNQHDIGTFKKFIDTMGEEGYEIAELKVKNPDTLKIEKFPDLEIRQRGITTEDLAPLGSFLQKAEISKPRSSTYSDFQMRFIHKGQPGKKENKQHLELIMLYGPHYSEAKELESKYVYNIARAFDRLHLNLKTSYPERTPGRRITSNIDVIKTRLREDISRPLFTNAYNADLKIKGEPKLPVVISKAHCEILDGYMSGIRQKIPMYYREARKRLKDDDYIIGFIKKSQEYQNREDKTISKKEIKAMRELIKTRLITYEAEDLGTITTAHELLKLTIKKYGEKV